MSDITVRAILELIQRYKTETLLKGEAFITEDSADKDILYIVFRSDPNYSRSPRRAAETVTYETTDGSEVHLDVNDEGLVLGIEFY